jgi:hypothetical protein
MIDMLFLPETWRFDMINCYLVVIRLSRQITVSVKQAGNNEEQAARLAMELLKEEGYPVSDDSETEVSLLVSNVDYRTFDYGSVHVSI